MNRVFHLYTDGSCRPHTDKLGCWAFVVVDAHSNEKIHEGYGVVENTTNITMELIAALEGLAWAWDELPEGRVKLFSDSQYVVNGVNEWYPKWKKNKWKNANGKKIGKKDIWVDLMNVHRKVRPTLKWVKGHNGNFWNEHVDCLCRNAIKKLNKN